MNRKGNLSNDIYESLLEDIVEHRLKNGDMLPSESQLQEKFGVSRITVRAALSRLEDEKLILAQSGRGRIVSSSVRTKMHFTNKEVLYFGTNAPNSAHVYQGLSEELRRFKVNSRFYIKPSPNPKEIETQYLETNDWDAVVFFWEPILEKDTADVLLQYNKPIFFCAQGDFTAFDSVYMESRKAFNEILSEINTSKYQSINYIFNNKIAFTHPTFRHRRRVFIDVFSKNTEYVSECYSWQKGPVEGAYTPEELVNIILKDNDQLNEDNQILLIMDSPNLAVACTQYILYKKPEIFPYLKFVTYVSAQSKFANLEKGLYQGALLGVILEDWQGMGALAAQSIYMRLSGGPSKNSLVQYPCHFVPFDQIK